MPRPWIVRPQLAPRKWAGVRAGNPAAEAASFLKTSSFAAEKRENIMIRIIILISIIVMVIVIVIVIVIVVVVIGVIGVIVVI